MSEEEKKKLLSKEILEEEFCSEKKKDDENLNKTRSILLSHFIYPEKREKKKIDFKKKDKSRDIRESEGEFIDITPKIQRKKRFRRKKVKFLPKEEETEESEIDTEKKDIEETFKNIESSISMKGENYYCLVARTALIIPFNYKIETQICQKSWLEQLKSRTFINLQEQKIPIWLSKDILPKEISDLNPQFRQMMGWKPEVSMNLNRTWTWYQMILNPQVLEQLFGTAKLVIIQNKIETFHEVKIEGIELVMFPLGSAALVYNINWIYKNKNQKELTLHDIRALIYASKYKYKVEGVSLGWCFTPDDKIINVNQIPDLHISCIGDFLFDSRYKGGTCSLNMLGNWLLHLPLEDPNNCPQRLNSARQAYHHSTIVINKEPNESTLQEYLFHLRRAFGQTNRPPPNAESSLGKVLVWRINRYIGISREGTVSLSWPVNEFEVERWHDKFQGIYLMLDLHVHGEKMVLLELSDMASLQAENLKFGSEEISFEGLKSARNKLRDLAGLMVRFTLSMSSGDCGGISEYSEFFVTLRKVFGITELREELSGELKDVLALVESNYLEEEKRQRDTIERERKKNIEIERERQKKRELQDQQFDVALSIFGSITVPFILISGIFGMNLTSLPVDIDFWQLMGVTFAVSIFVFLTLILFRFYPNFWRIHKKRKNYSMIREDMNLITKNLDQQEINIKDHGIQNG